jgi:hypothetical protein
MNVNIKRLAAKATTKMQGENGTQYDVLDTEKFAELLIRECALIPDWAIETGKDQLVETCMAQRASKAILDNFGLSP